MSGYEGLPQIPKYEAKWIEGIRNVQILAHGQYLYFTWDEACALAKELNELLEMERRP